MDFLLNGHQFYCSSWELESSWLEFSSMVFGYQTESSSLDEKSCEFVYSFFDNFVFVKSLFM